MISKNTLFISETHGNEKIGTIVLKDLEKKGFKISSIIGNLKASSKDLRYIQKDLNRAAPGSSESPIYEENRAAEILKKSNMFEFIVDLHGTTSNTGVFIIITKLTRANLELADKFNIENIVIWESKEEAGPLTAFMNCAIEIESGPKSSKETEKILGEILEKYINNYSPKLNKKYYRVSGKIDNTANEKISEFKESTVNGKTIIPLMIGQYDDCIAYNLIKVDKTELIGLTKKD